MLIKLQSKFLEPLTRESQSYLGGHATRAAPRRRGPSASHTRVTKRDRFRFGSSRKKTLTQVLAVRLGVSGDVQQRVAVPEAVGACGTRRHQHRLRVAREEEASVGWTGRLRRRDTSGTGQTCTTKIQLKFISGQITVIKRKVF